jgi:membrane fusion protein, multidrug efflux system
MNKKIKWGIIGVIILGLTFLGYHTFKPRKNKAISDTPMVTGPRNNKLIVRYIVIRPKDLVDGINISGSLIPNEEVNLSFETSGKITGIYFDEGSHVRKGELLAKINDSQLQAQLKKLTAEQKLTEDRLSRQKVLYEKEAISEETYQEADANLTKLCAEIEEVNAKIAQTELRAPFNGIVGLRQVSLGAFTSPNSNIATLTSIDKLKVEFSVPERYAGVLQNGAKLTFTVEGDQQPHEATVYATNSKVDADTRTFTVRAIYNNSDEKLVPGRYVSVSLNTRTYKNTMAVPSEAIVSEMGIDKVFLYKSGTAVPTNIVKGLRTDAEVQIISGLEIGDTVITSGTMQLRTGQKVELK